MTPGIRDNWQVYALLALAAVGFVFALAALSSPTPDCTRSCPPGTRAVLVKAWATGWPECVCGVAP